MKKTSVLNVFCEICKMFLIITMCYLGSRCWDIIQHEYWCTTLSTFATNYGFGKCQWRSCYWW